MGGIFYPTGETSKLSFYSKYFSSAEIDSTFYAYPKKGLAFGWARNTPENFVFSAKLPRLITHDKTLETGKGVKLDVLRFLEVTSPLINDNKPGAYWCSCLPVSPTRTGTPNWMGFLKSFLPMCDSQSSSETVLG